MGNAYDYSIILNINKENEKHLKRIYFLIMREYARRVVGGDKDV